MGLWRAKVGKGRGRTADESSVERSNVERIERLRYRERRKGFKYRRDLYGEMRFKSKC